MAAGMSIFTLMGEVLVDNTKANESISKTEQKAESLGGKLMQGVGTAAKWGAAIGGAAIAGGAALFGMATKSADATDRIDKLSQKIGISRKGFQELEYVLSQNGTDIEKLQVGLKTLTQRMGEAAEGTGKGAEAFERLNLSSVDLNGNLKTQEVMFEETAKALMGMPEGAEKSQLAFDLFGKAGLELMPLLNGTAEGMDELKQAANDMGLVLSDESVAAGAKFTDTMDNVKRSLSAAATNIGVTIMPAIQTLLDWVLAHMPEIQEIIRVVFEKIGQFVGIVVDIFQNVLIPAFQKIYDWTAENWPAIQNIIKTVTDLIVEVIQTFVDIFTMIWEKYGEYIKEFIRITWDLIKGIFQTAVDLIKGIVDFFIAVFTGDWEKMGESIRTITDTFWNLIKTLWDVAIEFIKNIFTLAIEALKTIANKIMTAVWDAFKSVWESIKTWVDTSWTNLKDAILGFKDSFFNAGKDIFTGVWDGIKDVWGKISSWVSEKVEWMKDKLSFWKDSADQMSNSSSPYSPGNDPPSKAQQIADRLGGSFANGLAYVPYNGFIAETHEGEGILTKAENKEYRENKLNGFTQNITINSPKHLSASEVARRFKDTSRKLVMEGL